MGERMNALFGKENPSMGELSNGKAQRQNIIIDGNVSRLSLYDGKHQLEFNEKTHRYKVNGQWISGVTSMLRRLDKGEGLIQWAANCAVDAYKRGADETTAKKAWQNVRDDAANIGKDAHAWICEFLRTGVANELSPEIEPCIAAFNKWWTIQKPMNVESERIVYSEKYNFCGTCDLIFDIRSPLSAGSYRVVADFKTGSPERERKPATKGWRGGYTGQQRAYQEHLYQCALYDQALFEETGKKADLYMIVYITKEGKMFSFVAEQTDIYHSIALTAVQLCAKEKALKDIHKFIF